MKKRKQFIILSELPKEEFDTAVTEMAERLKDLVYMKAESVIKQAVGSIMNNKLSGNYSIVVDYEQSFVVNDLLQIIGEKRRRR